MPPGALCLPFGDVFATIRNIMTGILYIIATPIGNLGDMTYRAVETLKTVDLVLCEDTRVSKNLFDHYGISTKSMSYHQHSDMRRIKEVEALLNEGKNLGLVTDAGTPGISDPGNILVSYLVKKGISVVPIPGVSALVTALSVSGVPTDRFTFLGFPPHKNKRQKYFQEVAKIEHTVAFYESGHRIMKCLGDLTAVLPPKREVIIGRELTKKFETWYRLPASQLSTLQIDERGEFVVIVAPI